jgi:hypothetical protein
VRRSRVPHQELQRDRPEDAPGDLGPVPRLPDDDDAQHGEQQDVRDREQGTTSD